MGKSWNTFASVYGKFLRLQCKSITGGLSGIIKKRSPYAIECRNKNNSVETRGDSGEWSNSNSRVGRKRFCSFEEVGYEHYDS